MTPRKQKFHETKINDRLYLVAFDRRRRSYQLNIAAHGNILKEGQRVGQLCIEPNGVTIGFIGRKLYLNNRYRSDSEQIIHWKIKMPASVYELLVSVENSRFFVFY